MADVVAKSTQPALAAIKLSWWRDAICELDVCKPPPEPRLQAIARELLPRGVSRTSLAGIAEGWAALLDEQPDAQLVAGRGTGLFAAGACLLGSVDERIVEAGSLYAFADAHRRGFGPFQYSKRRIRVAKPLRPLTALAALAARDLTRKQMEAEATPGRALALIRHRLTGRIF